MPVAVKNKIIKEAKKIIPVATRNKYRNKKEIIQQLEAEIQQLKNQLRDSQGENSELLENLNLTQESSENWEENYLRESRRNRNLTAGIERKTRNLWRFIAHLNQQKSQLEEEVDLLTQRARELEGAFNASKDGEIWKSYEKAINSQKASERELNTIKVNYNQVKAELEAIRKENSQAEIIRLESRIQRLNIHNHNLQAQIEEQKATIQQKLSEVAERERERERRFSAGIRPSSPKRATF